MKDKTEFLERIGVFPLVQGSVITLDPNVGAEIDIEGIETSGVCPLSQLRGMIVGEEGLFFMTHYGEDGALVVSYQKAAQYEALYNEALANAIHYVSVREATEAGRADGLEGARASFSGGLLRDVVG